jgi:hypothetical protein
VSARAAVEHEALSRAVEVARLKGSRSFSRNRRGGADDRRAFEQIAT